MAITISSVVRASPLPPPPRLNPSSTPCPPTKGIHAPSWRRRECLSAIASVVISSSAIGFAWGSEGSSLAVDPPASLRQTGEQGGSRWSDRRACPQWRPNSLESIVPENLPRPTGRLRSNEVAVDRPAALISATRNCFSM